VSIARDRITFEGKQTTERTKDMLLEARFLFRVRGGGAHPTISQGGWSSAVGASANTHLRDALDLRTGSFTLVRRKLWEWCVWEVGFASWRRSRTSSWPAHDHALPKGGWLSDAAAGQIRQWKQGDNALKSDLDYPRILSSGFVAREWEGYLKSRPEEATVDLSGLQQAFRTGKRQDPANDVGDNDVKQVQGRLNFFCDSKLLIDGIPGSATRGVYELYQARLFGVPRSHPDADGIPAPTSLKRLRLKTLA
jgi:hypothetical protein